MILMKTLLIKIQRQEKPDVYTHFIVLELYF